MKQEDIYRMAEEAGWNDGGDHINIERFAALVAEAATEAANARATSSWTLMCKKMVAFENEACAKVCDEARAARLAEVIRARGQA
jgi:hypothetical protein